MYTAFFPYEWDSPCHQLRRQPPVLYRRGDEVAIGDSAGTSVRTYATLHQGLHCTDRLQSALPGQAGSIAPPRQPSHFPSEFSQQYIDAGTANGTYSMAAAVGRYSAAVRRLSPPPLSYTSRTQSGEDKDGGSCPRTAPEPA